MQSNITRVIGDFVIRQREPVGEGLHPVLLLLHGWTGDENVMWIFTQRLSWEYLIISPRGLYPTPLGGYGWHAQISESWPKMLDFYPAIEQIHELLTNKNFPGADFSRIYSIGFSQGAAFMYAISLVSPEQISLMAGLSGFLPVDLETYIEGKPLQGKKIFIAHGKKDELVPIDVARNSVAVLEKAGARVAYCEEDVGHKLSTNCFRGMETFFEINGV